MKNLYFLSILFFSLAFITSCEKEEDIISTNVSIEEPQEGETKELTGLVRDTSGMVISQAGVKVIIDDLELITEADENGVWSLTVPANISDAFIVANKVLYSKSIQRLEEVNDNQVTDILLTTAFSNTELDLSFNKESIRVVKGRIVDENQNPISYVSLLMLHVLQEGPPNLVEFGPFTNTKVDGTFEFVYENNNYPYSIINSIFSSICGENKSIRVEGEDLLEDVGDQILEAGELGVFDTRLESDGSSCYDNASAIAYSFDPEGGFSNVLFDQPLGDISLAVCSTKDLYLGVESDGKLHFNGMFLSPQEEEDVYAFDICTPNPESFLELNINGERFLFEEDLEFASQNQVRYVSNNGQEVSFSVFTLSSFLPPGSNNAAYNIGQLTSLSVMLSDFDFGFSPILGGIPDINYVNIVQNDLEYYSGIVQVNPEMSDGSIADVKIRFRVAR